MCVWWYRCLGGVVKKHCIDGIRFVVMFRQNLFYSVWNALEPLKFKVVQVSKLQCCTLVLIWFRCFWKIIQCHVLLASYWFYYRFVKTDFEAFWGPSLLTAFEARPTASNVMNFKVSVLLCFKIVVKIQMFWKDHKA